jgi:hypothetical protein
MSDVGSGYRRRWAVLALVLAAECMDLLDGSIVNVAAPTISSELRASTAALQWIISGYALAFAIGLLTGARLGDRYGRKRLFVAGSAGFAAASLAAALSSGMSSPPPSEAAPSPSSARSSGSLPSSGRSSAAPWSASMHSERDGGSSSASTSRWPWPRRSVPPGSCRNPVRRGHRARTAWAPCSEQPRWACSSIR